jgi:hypothetical protein
VAGFYSYLVKYYNKSLADFAIITVCFGMVIAQKEGGGV